MAIETPPPVSEIHPLLRGGALVRLGGWAGAALLAVGLLALTAQTEIGSERLQGVIAIVSPQSAVAKAELQPANDAEIRRLETLVVALTDDRDRLHTRIASLERKLEDTTGSIKQQQATLAAKVAAVPPPPPPPQPVMPILAPLSSPPGLIPDGAWPAPQLPPAETVEAAPVPLPPTRVALAPVEEPAAEAPRKPEIGIDLGGAANLDVLNARWVAVKANFGPQLAGLYPRAQASNRSGSANYRLVAGPLPNNATAAQICAHFITARITCRTVRFEGERLVQR
jgi:hypothetical protein